MAAEWIAGALMAYSAAGALFAAWFVTRALDRFDAAARGTGVAFRAILFPGAAALWPVLLAQWIRREEPHG